MPSVTVREATSADLPAILALYADDALSLHPPGADPGVYEAAFEAIARDPRSGLYVALAPDVVGTFQMTVVDHLTGRVAYLESVHVLSSARGRGIGAAMMRWALDEARARGCSRASLTSQKRREGAHRFYERLGFVRSHEGMKRALDPAPPGAVL